MVTNSERKADADIRMVETYEEQTELWHKGESCHVRVGNGYECCPDFSCCYPQCAHSQEVRDKFVNGDAPTREAMYGQFLVEFIEKVRGDKRVHVIGG